MREDAEPAVALPEAAREPPPEPRGKAHIDRAQNQLPADARGWKYQSALQGKSLVVLLTPPEGTGAPAKAAFFPEREGLIEPAAAQKVTREGRALRIEMKLADPPPAGVKAVKGVAVSDAGWPAAEGRKAINVDAPISSSLGAAAATTSPASALGGGTLVALLSALIGGGLLNLMPCVFPVLGIKVMGFVEHAHGEAPALRMHGIVYTIGVLVSFAVLTGLMLALRESGTQLGWGFQLQSPAVITLLAALFFVLALNLSGVFEWGAFAQSMTSNLSARG